MRIETLSSACLLLLLAACLAAPAWAQINGPPELPAADPATAGDSPSDSDLAASQRFLGLVTEIVQANLPDRYENTKDWGQTKRVWDGVDFRREGLRIKTKRRMKAKNHGTWKRYEIRLANPAQPFPIRVDGVAQTPTGRIEFDARAEAELEIFGRLARWERGVQLFSFSTNADARVHLHAHCSLGLSLDPTKIPPDVKLDAEVTNADLRIVDFKLRRISDLSGPFVEPLSHGVREVLEDEINKRRPKLVAQINRQLEKESDTLRLSLQDLMESRWSAIASRALSSENMGDTTAAP